MRVQTRITAVFLAAFVLLTAGCAGPERGAVEGVVRRNGRPVADVVVTFLPKPDAATRGLRATAQADGEGHFRLRSEDQKDGVVVGEYRIVVEDLAVYSAPRTPDGTLLSKPPPRFPARYGDSLQTPLRHRVQPGTQTVTLDLDGPL